MEEEDSPRVLKCDIFWLTFPDGDRPAAPLIPLRFGAYSYLPCERWRRDPVQLWAG